MKLKILLLSFLAVFLMAGSAFALELGTNITIYDNRIDSSGNSWWNNENEDQEVEPGMVYDQSWDLEGFFLNGTILTMVGGFNFITGKWGYESGDIFIDIDGNAQYGLNPDTTVLNYGYDYVLDLDFVNFNYDVYALSPNSILSTVVYYNDPESSPWRYGGGDGVLDGWDNVGFTYIGFGILTDSDTGFLGDAHNAVAVDLGFLGSDIDNFIAHFTMGCGNDNLMGSVPEPSTMLLFGTGLLGLAAIGRKKLFKK